MIPELINLIRQNGFKILFLLLLLNDLYLFLINRYLHHLLIHRDFKGLHFTVIVYMQNINSDFNTWSF